MFIMLQNKPQTQNNVNILIFLIEKLISFPLVFIKNKKKQI